MTSILDRLGVTPIINACGTVTRLGGGPLHPDVVAAMAAASEIACDMPALQGVACKVIAAATGAAAGIVTSGASAAVLLGAAACLAGLDPGRMNRLPEVPDGRREFIVVRSQRNMYDRALVVAGARIVEVGIADRFSGPGVRDAAPWEIEDAIGPATVGLYYLAQPQSQPPLRAVADVARRHGIPVLVDAAAQLPPASNLRLFLQEGADLVAFSGGKAIGGPQASGILCGRADLVSSALVQMLDMDVREDAWSPPAAFAPLAQLRGLPHHGIGRSCKAGKEEIVGLMAALQRFAAEDEAARLARWRAMLEAILKAAGTLPGVELSLDDDPARHPVPMVRATFADAAEARRVAAALRAGTPPVECQAGRIEDGVLLFAPVALRAEQAEEVGRRLRAAASSGTK